MRPELSLLTPIFEEEQGLDRALPLLLDAAEAMTERFELLIVDDGSRDAGPKRVESLAGRDARVRLVRHGRNLGPGAALPTGRFWARGDWVLFVPADLACEPEDLIRMWRARADADLVVGLRSDRRDYGWGRKALSHAYIGIVRLLSGSKIRQFNYLQMVHRSLFERLTLHARGVFVTAEIILGAERLGARIAEVPLRYVPRRDGVARGASPRATARCAWELARHFLVG